MRSSASRSRCRHRERPRRWPSPSRWGRGRARRRAGGGGNGTRPRRYTRPPPSRDRAAARPRMRRPGRSRSRPGTWPRAMSRSRHAGGRGRRARRAPAAPSGRRGCGRSRSPGDAAWHRTYAYPPRPMSEVSRERFVSWFGELAAIGYGEGGWNRLAWSPLEAEARAWFSRTATSIGLEVQQDGAGSLWAVTDDAERGPWVCAGSHLDTQPDGGAYDGALGVVAALEAAAVGARVRRRAPASAGGGRVRRRGGSAVSHPHLRQPGADRPAGHRSRARGDGRRARDLRRHPRLAGAEPQAARPGALLLRGARRAGPVAGRP